MSIHSVKPHIVNTSLDDKVILLYGQPQTGKTTAGSQFPKHLILAFEQGYKALPGCYAIDIDNWISLRKYMQELIADKKQKGKDSTYQTIVIDTIGIADEMCEQYICNKHGVQQIGDVAYGALYKEKEKELKNFFLKLTSAGYSLVILGHADEIREDSKNGDGAIIGYEVVVSKKTRVILNQICDIILHLDKEFVTTVNENGVETFAQDEFGAPKIKVIARTITNANGRSKSRYKIPSKFTFTYDNLKDAVKNAVLSLDEAYVTETDEIDFAKKDNEIKDIDSLIPQIQTLTAKAKDLDLTEKAKEKYIQLFGGLDVKLSNSHIDKALIYISEMEEMTSTNK